MANTGGDHLHNDFVLGWMPHGNLFETPSSLSVDRWPADNCLGLGGIWAGHCVEYFWQMYGTKVPKHIMPTSNHIKAGHDELE